MQVINKNGNTYVLRLDPGEELLASVEGLCLEKNIKSGWLQAIGSVKELEIAYFDAKSKEYKTLKFDEFLEVINISGNIALKEGKIFCHAHGIFSREDMSALAGHVMKCVVSATAEVIIFGQEGEVRREYDEETGLHLLE